MGVVRRPQKSEEDLIRWLTNHCTTWEKRVESPDMQRVIHFPLAISIVAATLCCLGMVPPAQAIEAEAETMFHHGSAHSCCPESTGATEPTPPESADCHATDDGTGAFSGVVSPTLQLVVVDPPHSDLIALTVGAQPAPGVARAPPDIPAATAAHLPGKLSVVLRT